MGILLCIIIKRPIDYSEFGNGRRRRDRDKEIDKEDNKQRRRRVFKGEPCNKIENRGHLKEINN